MPLSMDLASLVAVSVVAVACSLLSLLLATLCWQQWETSRPSHTYCAQCLYGAVREAGELAHHRLGMAAQLDRGPGRGNLGSSHLLEARGLDTQTIDLTPAGQEPLLDPASLDLEASTLSRSFQRQKGNSREEEEVLVSIESEPPCEASKLSQVRVLVSPPTEGSPTPLTTTPANSRARRASSRKRVPASLPPQPPPGETTDDSVVGARVKMPLARAATVTAGSRQVPLKVLQGRSRHWSDPKAMRKKGSPGHTATAGYMAEQSQRNSPNVPFDIDFGDEPQPALAPRGLTSSQLQAPRPYRPGYSESEATSDDSCYRPRPPTSFRLSPSPHPPEVFSEGSSQSRPSSRPSRPSSLTWDNYESGPHFPEFAPPIAMYE